MDVDHDGSTAPIGARRISEFVGALGFATLERLTGELMPVEAAPTDMIARISRAWTTPLDQLTCEQLRLLVSQGMAPSRLIGPALSLLRLRPCAQVTFYPGDLAGAVLRHAADALAHCPEGARAFLGGSFDWIDALSDEGTRTRYAGALAAARRCAAGDPEDAEPARNRHGRPPRSGPLRRRAGARVRRRAG